jgi:hypothetical protein
LQPGHEIRASFSIKWFVQTLFCQSLRSADRLSPHHSSILAIC